MSALADKPNPKHFMIFGLVMSGVVNLMMGFSASFWIFLFLCILNGIFQGMGAGPAYVVLTSWFPRKSRGVTTAFFNISHNVGGAIAWLGTEHWQAAYFIVPTAIAAVALTFYIFGKGCAYNEGLPPMNQILNNADEELVVTKTEDVNLTTWQIFKQYILKDINVWFVSFIDVFTYMIRFGILAWLLLYLLETKGFSKGQMATAFAIFEWTVLPPTLPAGYVTDKYFKGKRMSLAIVTLPSSPTGVGRIWPPLLSVQALSVV
nr:MFS transporter [Neisseria iguanae]